MQLQEAAFLAAPAVGAHERALILVARPDGPTYYD
jgi:hypothetical protein